jgi:hypothetical protein
MWPSRCIKLATAALGERATGIHWTGDWFDPRAPLGDVKKRKFLNLQGFEFRSLGRPAPSQSLYRLLFPGSFPFIIQCSQLRLLNRMSWSRGWNSCFLLDRRDFNRKQAIVIWFFFIVLRDPVPTTANRRIFWSPQNCCIWKLQHLFAFHLNHAGKKYLEVIFPPHVSFFISLYICNLPFGFAVFWSDTTEITVILGLMRPQPVYNKLVRKS